MVDFNKLRASQNQPLAVDPLEIFRRLPKPEGINDLYVSQAQVLETWFNRRTEKDMVIKLHTGGGKTLVGLLIAQSIMNETKHPVMYLAANNQLVEQTHNKANEYNLPSTMYQSGVLPDDFLSAKSVLICNYHVLFNGRSLFGVRDLGRSPTKIGGIILDDAHVAFSTMRDIFTLNVKRDTDEEEYRHLVALFSNDFKELDKLGTFNDIVSGNSFSILEVPYWSWQSHYQEVLSYLQPKSQTEYRFVWPLLRDAFLYCHCFISQQALTITPIFPLVDLFPTFQNCPRRIFMSATTGDDSAIVQTFDADEGSVASPIVSNSLAGVSERMILIPQLMNFMPKNTLQMLHEIVKNVARDKNWGAVILVPSFTAAEDWKVAGKIAEADLVVDYIQQLQQGINTGPFIFANRYDGIDLPGDTCRLLILSELPKGLSDYDSYQTSIFEGSELIDNALARRIEQGIGRGARGTADWCVVILYGDNLVSWISRDPNLQLLTSSTRAQLKIGETISKNINSEIELLNTIQQCFSRDKKWIEYHAETLALAKNQEPNIDGLALVDIQRKVFDLIRQGHHDKAIAQLEKFIEKEIVKIDSLTKGWLLQFAARIAHQAGFTDKSQELQKESFANNRNLLRPRQIPSYEQVVAPSSQSEAIVRYIQRFNFRRGVLADFDNKVSKLTPQATAGQFEEALVNLGRILGFSVERPEKEWGTGPDAIWLLNGRQALIFEVKSRKDVNNPFKKEEHGQLLNSAEWFKKEYANYEGIPISVHPNTFMTKDVAIGEVKALTLDRLNYIVSETRELITKLSAMSATNEEMIVYCQQLLSKSNLSAEKLPTHYLEEFQVK